MRICVSASRAAARWTRRRATGFPVARLAACALVGAVLLGPFLAEPSWAGPSFAPGFCAAPAAGDPARSEPAWGEVSIASVGRSVQTAVYVDCRELVEWRAGERESFSHYGAVTLYRGRELVAKAFPALAQAGRLSDAAESMTLASSAEIETASIAAPGLVQERISRGVLYRTHFLEKGAALPAEPAASMQGAEAVARAESLTLHLSGASLSEAGDAAIERSMVMPYQGDDTLRYLQAALLAGVAADQIALLSLY